MLILNFARHQFAVQWHNVCTADCTVHSAEHDGSRPFSLTTTCSSKTSYTWSNAEILKEYKYVIDTILLPCLSSVKIRAKAMIYSILSIGWKAEKDFNSRELFKWKTWIASFVTSPCACAVCSGLWWPSAADCRDSDWRSRDEKVQLPAPGPRIDCILAKYL